MFFAHLLAIFSIPFFFHRYDSHDVVRKGWRDESVLSSLDTPPSRGKRIIILHAGCEAGWIPGALLIAAKNIKDASADYHQVY